MKLDRDGVRHIALLARLGVTEDDLERFSGQLSHILENFEILQQVETIGVLPTSHSITLYNVLRDDDVAPSLNPAEVLANAPQEEDGCFRIRAVLE